MKQGVNQGMAMFLSIILILQITYPTVTFAYSDEGPGQPEVQTFKPASTDNLVDLFTGDFQYNIPLLDVGGYPINIFYNSNVGVHDQASFVGLGWNLNPGSINRNVRGIPDDFSGEKLTREHNVKDNITYGGSVGTGIEAFGVDPALNIAKSYNLGIRHNNYSGLSIDISSSTGLTAGNMAKGRFTANLGMTNGINSSKGAYLEPSLSASYNYSKAHSEANFGLGISTSVNSIEGLKSLNITASVHQKSSIGSGNIQFANTTYTPTIEIPKINSAYSGNFSFGGELFGLNGNIRAKGYWSKQTLATKKYELPAYGYVYADKAPDDGNVMLDFNREKDNGFNMDNPTLPLTSFTYDTYVANGQGLNGNFRPYRGDIGTLSDPYVKDKNDPGQEYGLEVGLGNAVHIGTDVQVTFTNSTTGKWTEGNKTSNIFKFKGKDSDNPAYEPVYFKNVGEMTPMVNTQLWKDLQEFGAVNVTLDRYGDATSIIQDSYSKKFKELDKEFIGHKTKREKRNYHFSFLTAHEAQSLGLEKNIRSYYNDVFYGSGDVQAITNFNAYSRLELYNYDKSLNTGLPSMKDHISEIKVTKDDGMRYIYGIPVYQNTKKEVSFNVSNDPGKSDRPVDDSTQLVTYKAGLDNSVNNGQGLNHYFNRVTTPAHATSFLLSAIVSSDYEDLTGNGPTTDDLGTYTKFNYTLKSEDYRWRTPFDKDKATFDEGYESAMGDQMGSYLYGEKELWYIHSIETKNYVAEFTLEDRLDAVSVQDENGGAHNKLDSSSDFNAYKVSKLTKIELYAKSERVEKQAKAIPIKTVHFEYDYSLCEGTPDKVKGKLGDEKGDGKLTLKKIYFTYGSSEKGSRSAYEFAYDNNPDYHRLAADRWGTYKENKTGSTQMDNARYPFAESNKSKADQEAGAWLLSDIKLPSGGAIQINYEADDYAYVQDKQAMQMVKIKGFDNYLTGRSLYTGGKVKNKIIVELPERINPGDTNSLYRYIEGIEELYFNCAVNTGEYGKGNFEKIQGFIKMSDELIENKIGLLPDLSEQGNSLAWIKTSEVDGGDDIIEFDTHPISKATWQFIRMNLPGIAYGQSNPQESTPAQLGDQLVNILKKFKETFTFWEGFNGRMKDKGRGRIVDLDQSFIRLNAANKRKIGGGSRVKRIQISDNWQHMVDPADDNIKTAITGWEYSYTTKDKINGKDIEISSGVASYEPLVGKEENPFTMPDRYKEKRPMALNNDLYNIEPYGESFYPVPKVGYSKVKVKAFSVPFNENRGNGHTINEFYTAKDFPTKVTRSLTKPKRKKVLIKILEGYDYLSASQGIAIETNNMHGKQKAQWVFSENDPEEYISGIEYKYQVNPKNRKELDNEIEVVRKNGERKKSLVGVEYDFIVDARHNRDEVYSMGFDANVDFFINAVFPAIVPSIFPNYASDKTMFRSITTTKLIHRSGVLKDIITHDLGSSNAVHNLAYDAETGQNLITKSKNSFNEPIYTTNIPAHWGYEGMGLAYLNAGIEINDFYLDEGIMKVGFPFKKYFHKGDELLIEHLRYDPNKKNPFISSWELGFEKVWVMKVNENSIDVVDETGKLLQSARNSINDLLPSIKIIRSGRRNQQGTSIGSVVTKVNPLPEGDDKGLTFNQVINSEAIEYSENWQTDQAINVDIQPTTCDCDEVYTNERDRIKATDNLKDILNGITIDGLMGNSLGRGIVREGSIRREGSVWSIELPPYEGDDIENLCTIKLKYKGGAIFPVVRGEQTPFTDVKYVIKDPTVCTSEINEFKVIVESFIDGNGVLQPGIELEGYTDCFVVATCREKTEPPITVCGDEGQIANPYRLGIRGNYRPLRKMMYVGERTTNISPQQNGIYKEFQPFWEVPAILDADSSRWTETIKNDHIGSGGKVFQTKDALGRYSANLYGYNNNVQVAVAKNAKSSQIGFDSFEDYDYKNQNTTEFTCEAPPHWKFDVDDQLIDATQSHSGKKSVRLDAYNFVSNEWMIEEDLVDQVSDDIPFILQERDLISPFKPSPGTYVISGWVKVPNMPDTLDDPRYISIGVQLSGTPMETMYFTATDAISVDGWRRITGTFDIKEEHQSITIGFVNFTPNLTAYFDDLRIQPIDAEMQAYVYDSENLRLMSVLDDHNFATYYEYDQEGTLIRNKKETERGVMTTREIRFGNVKK